MSKGGWMNEQEETVLKPSKQVRISDLMEKTHAFI
jgi:hypothetical protein